MELYFLLTLTDPEVLFVVKETSAVLYVEVPDPPLVCVPVKLFFTEPETVSKE